MIRIPHFNCLWCESDAMAEVSVEYFARAIHVTLEGRFYI